MRTDTLKKFRAGDDYPRATSVDAIGLLAAHVHNKKRFHTLRLGYAITGYSLHRTDLADELVTYSREPRGLGCYPHTLHDTALFLVQIGRRP